MKSSYKDYVGMVVVVIVFFIIGFGLIFSIGNYPNTTEELLCNKLIENKVGHPISVFETNVVMDWTLKDYCEYKHIVGEEIIIERIPFNPKVMLR